MRAFIGWWFSSPLDSISWENFWYPFLDGRKQSGQPQRWVSERTRTRQQAARTRGADLRRRLLGFSLKLHLLPGGEDDSGRAHLTQVSLLRTRVLAATAQQVGWSSLGHRRGKDTNLISLLVLCCLFDPHDFLLFLHGAPGCFHCFLRLYSVTLQNTRTNDMHMWGVFCVVSRLFTATIHYW